TLEYQARERLTDLMWQPVATAGAVQQVVRDVRPDAVIVDHLAFSARLALVAAGVPHADVVLGHPSALPVGDEVYGYPPAWPAAFDPDPAALRALHTLCEQVSTSFTAEWNRALNELDPGARPTENAFAAHGDLLLLNYPAALADPARPLPEHAFLGSAVRSEASDPQVEAWLAASADPFVYVSFGSFLSVRSDVLSRVAAALRGLGVRAAIATGSADPAELGELPGDWLVREFLPQVTLLRHAAAAVSHGGNNSVTEAMTCGVPLVVLPFSTDQFAGAAAIERAGFGVALDPNRASVAELRAAVEQVVAVRPAGLAAVAGELQARPGAERAFAALSAAAPSANTSSRIAAGSPDAAR
ncbi:MAG TPA: glycosyltransferase, partial [Pseudolysinimonas sp.]|nr:glycosyltransferase [Pseudolysinimonas sp.]